MPFMMIRVHQIPFPRNNNDVNLPRRAEGWMLPGC
jgi:hypothetical protein